MKKIQLLLLAACSFAALQTVAADPVEKEVKYSEITLENNFLTVSLLPDSMGRINRITVKKNGYDILFPRHALCTDFGSLLKRVKGNAFGSADTFIQRDLRSMDQKMSVEQPDKNSVIFTVKNYGGMPINMSRKISLPENSTAVKVESQIQWLGKDGSVLTPRWDFFLNGGDPLHSRRHLFIPLVKEKSPDGKGVKLQRWKQRTVVPSDNFLAVIIPPKDLTFALTVNKDDFGAGSKFYTLSSGYNRRWYWWMSFILPPEKMASGASRKYSFEAAVYPGLKNLQDICGDIAMYAYVTRNSTPWRLGVVMMPAHECHPEKITITLTPESGNPVSKDFTLPAMTPGKIHNITWTLSGVPAGKYRISGNISGKGDFDFAEPVIQIK